MTYHRTPTLPIPQYPTLPITQKIWLSESGLIFSPAHPPYTPVWPCAPSPLYPRKHNLLRINLNYPHPPPYFDKRGLAVYQLELPRHPIPQEMGTHFPTPACMYPDKWELAPRPIPLPPYPNIARVVGGQVGGQKKVCTFFWPARPLAKMRRSLPPVRVSFYTKLAHMFETGLQGWSILSRQVETGHI